LVPPRFPPLVLAAPFSFCPTCLSLARVDFFSLLPPLSRVTYYPARYFLISTIYRIPRFPVSGFGFRLLFPFSRVKFLLRINLRSFTLTHVFEFILFSVRAAFFPVDFLCLCLSLDPLLPLFAICFVLRTYEFPLSPSCLDYLVLCLLFCDYTVCGHSPAFNDRKPPASLVSLVSKVGGLCEWTSPCCLFFCWFLSFFNPS